MRLRHCIEVFRGMIFKIIMLMLFKNFNTQRVCALFQMKYSVLLLTILNSFRAVSAEQKVQ